jgi:hypothetical protein
VSTDDFDPMTLLGGALPAPSAWESLARHARWLADHAEKVAAMDPSARVRYDEDGDEDLDHLALLDKRALGVRGLVAACRRDTYQALLDEGWSVKKIARHWGVSNKAVYKSLGRP